jgi:hypothetical protein
LIFLCAALTSFVGTGAGGTRFGKRMRAIGGVWFVFVGGIYRGVIEPNLKCFKMVL